MEENKTESDWKQSVQQHSLKWAYAAQTTWGVYLKEAIDKVPVKSQETVAEVLKIHCESLVAMMVGLLAQNISGTVEYEEDVVNDVRSKFKYYRTEMFKQQVMNGPKTVK